MYLHCVPPAIIAPILVFFMDYSVWQNCLDHVSIYCLCQLKKMFCSCPRPLKYICELDGGQKHFVDIEAKLYNHFECKDTKVVDK